MTETGKVAENAFLQGAVPALLRGEAPGQVRPEWFYPAASPVDWGDLVQNGILPVLFSDPSGDRVTEFFDAVGVLLCGSAEDAWKVYNLWFSLHFHVQIGDPLLRDFPRQQLRDALLHHRDTLCTLRKWSGADLKEGLWEDLMQADRALRTSRKDGLL